MEEDMDVEVQVFEVVEIDLDYEYEAARFFDFTKEETEEEVCEAEFWFGTGKSYPPSPFVAEMFSMKKILSDSVNVSPKMKCTDGQEQNQQDETFGGSYRGLAFYDCLSTDVKNLKTKASIKPYLPRSSTLMKPTASQLAKQNSRIKVGDSRFQRQQTSFNVPCGVDVQASKRQKLDVGELHKVGDMKQVNNLVHKAPKKDGNVSGVSSHNRIKITIPASDLKKKITIPADPDLATASRTQRLVGYNKGGTTGRASTFKARPLNQKILKAPTLPLSKKSTARLPEFEVFHLKTMERAKQHGDAIKPTFPHQPYKGFKKPGADHLMDSRSKPGSRSKSVDTHSEDIRKAGDGFEARPLKNKEFSFQAHKRPQHNPLTELFGKLSLASEGVQQKKSASPKLLWSSCISSKGTKENRGGVFQQDHNMKDR